MPNSIVEIETSAFVGCRRLEHLVLPNALKKICREAFLNCQGLTGTLTLPDTVNTIGPGAFSGFVFMATILFMCAFVCNTYTQMQTHAYAYACHTVAVGWREP